MVQTDTVICVSESVYGASLTYGHSYKVLAWDMDKNQVRVQNDRGQSRWYPLFCFASPNTSSPSIVAIHHESISELQSPHAIEVEIELADGQKRWCFFSTPDLLRQTGDLLEGTNIRFHYHLPHMIVVNYLTDEAIERIVNFIYTQGELLACTLPVDNPGTFQGEQQS